MEQYTQKHHILPKSISPQSKDIIILSAREHFIAHALLIKITQKSQNKQNYYKMVYAFNNMNRNGSGKRYTNSHLYELLKRNFNQVRKQIIKQFNPSKDKIWICNPKLEQNKLWDKNQQIPKGWIKKRVCDFKLYKRKLENKIQKEKQKQQKRKLAKEYLEQYKISGYKGIIQKYNYHYTYRILLMMFKKWIPNQWKEYKDLHIR